MATLTTPRSIHSYDLDGYQAREPQREAAAIDRDIAGQCDCPLCGHKGLTYRPFIRPAEGRRTRSYRCFAVCPRCGDAQEF